MSRHIIRIPLLSFGYFNNLAVLTVQQLLSDISIDHFPLKIKRKVKVFTISTITIDNSYHIYLLSVCVCLSVFLN